MRKIIWHFVWERWWIADLDWWGLRVLYLRRRLIVIFLRRRLVDIPLRWRLIVVSLWRRKIIDVRRLLH